MIVLFTLTNKVYRLLSIFFIYTRGACHTIIQTSKTVSPCSYTEGLSPSEKEAILIYVYMGTVDIYMFTRWIRDSSGELVGLWKQKLKLHVFQISTQFQSTWNNQRHSTSLQFSEWTHCSTSKFDVETSYHKRWCPWAKVLCESLWHKLRWNWLFLSCSLVG